MTTVLSPKRLGFFTRLLDEASAAERYRLATQQIVHAERCGFDSAWIAQHHFHEGEGGLPAPFVFLAQAAVQTSRIRLGTGIVTLPLELPVRVAEDAAVTDLFPAGCDGVVIVAVRFIRGGFAPNASGWIQGHVQDERTEDLFG